MRVRCLLNAQHRAIPTLFYAYQSADCRSPESRVVEGKYVSLLLSCKIRGSHREAVISSQRLALTKAIFIVAKLERGGQIPHKGRMTWSLWTHSTAGRDQRWARNPARSVGSSGRRKRFPGASAARNLFEGLLLIQENRPDRNNASHRNRNSIRSTAVSIASSSSTAEWPFADH